MPEENAIGLTAKYFRDSSVSREKMPAASEFVLCVQARCARFLKERRSRETKQKPVIEISSTYSQIQTHWRDALIYVLFPTNDFLPRSFIGKVYSNMVKDLFRRGHPA